MIPYDIEEPVLRLDAPGASLLVDAHGDGRISWIDLLPEDVTADERAKQPPSAPPE